jgi:hypothetical protein
MSDDWSKEKMFSQMVIPCYQTQWGYQEWKDGRAQRLEIGALPRYRVATTETFGTADEAEHISREAVNCSRETLFCTINGRLRACKFPFYGRSHECARGRESPFFALFPNLLHKFFRQPDGSFPHVTLLEMNRGRSSPLTYKGGGEGTS